MTGPRKLSESFKNRANEACFWEAYVSTVLARSGLYVGHYPFSLGEYADPEKGTSHDLDVSINGEDPVWPCEVKSRNLSFTAESDFPYPDINVCSQSFFLRNWPGYDTLGRDFLFVSTKTGAIVWLPAGTPVQMGKEICDTTRGEVFKVVTCESKYLRSLTEFVAAVKKGPGEN